MVERVAGKLVVGPERWTSPHTGAATPSPDRWIRPRRSFNGAARARERVAVTADAGEVGRAAEGPQYTSRRSRGARWSSVAGRSSAVISPRSYRARTRARLRASGLCPHGFHDDGRAGPSTSSGATRRTSSSYPSTSIFTSRSRGRCRGADRRHGGADGHLCPWREAGLAAEPTRSRRVRSQARRGWPTLPPHPRRPRARSRGRRGRSARGCARVWRSSRGQAQGVDVPLRADEACPDRRVVAGVGADIDEDVT